MGNSIKNMCNTVTGDSSNEVNMVVHNLNPYDIPIESLTNDQIDLKLREEFVIFKF